MKRLLSILIVVAAASLAFCAVNILGHPSPLHAGSPSDTIVFTITLNGLTGAAASSTGIASRYVITNLALATTYTAHELYDDADQIVYIGSTDSLAPLEARTYDLADLPVPDTYEGYAIIMADRPITGTVLPTETYAPSPFIYLPLVIQQPSPPPPPAPLVVGETVRFAGAWNEVPLEGKVIFSEYRDVLIDDYDGPVYPDGVFVVAVMDVTNHGLESDEVGRYNSFKLRDSVGRQFDIAELDVLFAAQDEYDYDSVYTAIQPSLTKRLVFAFDVFPGSEDLYLISLSPW